MPNDPAYKNIDSPRGDKRYSEGSGPDQKLDHGTYTKIAGVICAIGMILAVILMLIGGLIFAEGAGNNSLYGGQRASLGIVTLISGIGLLVTTSLTGVLVEISRKLTK